MIRLPQIRMLPDRRRLHLQDGPVDLVIQADGRAGEIATAYRAAIRTFSTVLDQLCAELPSLRKCARPEGSCFSGPVARLMDRAVSPFAAHTFITPMAAVAGSVAESVLAAMTSTARLDRAFVNNGGDIALQCAPGFSWTIGLIDRPDKPGLFGRVAIGSDSGVRGVATSGWRGRSFSLGIADSVTVLAQAASSADAAATIVANAVDLPSHPAVRRVPASSVQCDSDLGDRLVTRDVGPLDVDEINRALDAGMRCAGALIARGLILGATLQLQGRVRVAGLAAVIGRSLQQDAFVNPASSRLVDA